MTAPWCGAASVDFAVGMSLPSLYNRFGVDSQGNILVAAIPNACSLPTVNPLSACGAIWIGKLDASGKSLRFATYLGSSIGNSYTSVAGIAADADGNVIVAAHTTASDLPTVKAVQPVPQSAFTSLYVAKLSSDGSQILYATYLGGTGGQSALSLAVDSAGAAYVAAAVNSTDFPTTPGAPRAGSPFPTAVVKLNADGTLQYSTTFDFEFYTDVKPIQLDAQGGAVLASNLEVLRVAADGSALARTPLPAWATQTVPCTFNGSGLPACPQTPWVLPRAGGGFQFAGAAAGGVPVTADAIETYGDANGYVRLQNGQAAYPQLPTPVSGIAADPRDGNRIYAATGGGLWVSADNGSTWSLLRDGAALAVAVDPFDSNRLYLSVDAVPQIYRSTDGGANWTAIGSGLSTGSRVMSLAADPHVRGLLYGAGGAVFRSMDGGDTWDSRPVGPSRPDMSPSASTFTTSQSVEVDPTHAGWAYVIGRTGCIGFCPVTLNLSRTEDGGNTWTTATTGADPLLPATGAELFAVDPNSGSVVEVLRQQTVIYPQGDFSASQALFPGEATAVAFDAANPGTIYLGVQVAMGAGSGYFVVQSMDGGATWSTVAQFDRPVYNLTVGAGGVLHGSQTAGVSEGYLLVTDVAGNIRYGTYLGGAYTQISSVAALGGKMYVAGTAQGGLPLANAAQPAAGGSTDGFVAAFDDAGTLLWSSYLGGSRPDTIDWVLPVADGSVVVVGSTSSADFPMLQPGPLGTGSFYIARLRP